MKSLCGHRIFSFSRATKLPFKFTELSNYLFKILVYWLNDVVGNFQEFNWRVGWPDTLCCIYICWDTTCCLMMLGDGEIEDVVHLRQLLLKQKPKWRDLTNVCLKNKRIG